MPFSKSIFTAIPQFSMVAGMSLQGRGKGRGRGRQTAQQPSLFGATAMVGQWFPGQFSILHAPDSWPGFLAKVCANLPFRDVTDRPWRSKKTVILCLHIRLTCSPYTIVGLPTMFQNQATTQQLMPDRRLLIQRALMALQRIYRSYTVSQCLKQISLHSIAIVPNMFTSTL